MTFNLEQQIQSIVNDFELELLMEENTTFEKYILKNQTEHSTLIDYCHKNHLKLNDLILDYLPKEKKKSIGPWFYSKKDELIKINGKEVYAITEEEIELINSNPQIREITKNYINISPYLTEEKREEMLEKISQLLYDKLDDATKEVLEKRTLKRYALNLGILESRRVNHKVTIDFIIKYKAIFKGEEEVISKIIGTYIDDEMAGCSIDDTYKKSNELKGLVKKLYEGI